jgi:polar amino acid transport system substrate-binding protein
MSALSRRWLCALCTAILAWAGPARALDLVVLVDTGTEMPMVKVVDQQLVDGIHHDVGQAIAAALGRRAVFRLLPRKRITDALAAGEADLLCLYLPEWLPGPFDWSRPFFPLAEVIISNRNAPRPRALRELAGKRIGTVLGYRHPGLDEVLGSSFVREDSASSELNLRKLAAGRIQYAITSAIYLDYRLQLNDPPLDLHEPLLVKTYRLQCAVSRRGQLPVARIDEAIAHIAKDNTLAHILARYKR